MKQFGLIFLLGFCLAFVSCGQADSFDSMVDSLLNQTVPAIRPNECPENVLFIDARELAEYQISHIEGALFVGYDDVNFEALDSVPKEQEIVVYCSVGYRSEKVGEQLLDNGFTNVSNLYGGLFLWMNENKAVVDNNGPTNRVHAYNQRWGKWLERGEKVYE